MHPWTFVTSYIRISDFDDTHPVGDGSRTDKYYFESAMVLDLDVHIVCYITPDLIPSLLERRKNFKHKTHVIGITLDDLPKRHHLPTLKKNMSNQDKHHYSPGHRLVVNSKVDIMRMAITLNPWNSSYFAWIDFGLGYICNNFPDLQHIIESKPDNIGIMSIFNADYNDENIDAFLTDPSWNTSAGFWFGASDNILWFADRVSELFEYAMSKNFFPMEEILFTVVIKRNPLRFNIWVGRYVELLINAYMPRSGLDFVMERITHEQNKLNHTEVLKLCNYASRNTTMHCTETLSILRFIMISAYFVDRNKGLEAAKSVISLAHTYPEVRSIVETYYTEYKNNFDFYKVPTETVYYEKYSDCPIGDYDVYVRDGFRPNIVETLPLSSPRLSGSFTVDN